MRIVALILRQGGGTRIQRLAEHVRGTDADVVIAGEFVPAFRGDALIDDLRAGGFTSFHSPGPPRDGYGVLLASRNRSAALRLNPAPVDRGRIVAANVGGLIIAGPYFSLGKDKASLFDYLLSRPPDLGDSFLVLGDLSTGVHHLDDRVVGRCYVNGTDLAAALIRGGFCAHCPRYDPLMRYLPAQLEAGR